MNRNYMLILLCFLLFSFSQISLAQDNSLVFKETSQDIDGLNMHPNPVSQGRIFITTKSNLIKNIEIFDVLGKRVLRVKLYGKELNLSKLKSGVYILKVKENNISATRKLVIK